MVNFRNMQHGNSCTAPLSASANNHIARHGAKSGRDTPSNYPFILTGDKFLARLDMITRPAWLDQ